VSTDATIDSSASTTARGPQPWPLPRLAAVLAAAIVGSAYYAIDRAIAFLRNGPPDPLGTMASPRIDYFWRIALATFIASLVLVAVDRLAPASPRLVQALLWTLAGTMVLGTVLGFAFP
jgi:hypothetical protein